MTVAPRTWATQRLDELINGPVPILPPVIQTLRLGALDEWGVGWVKKRWHPHPDLLTDQTLAFAAMMVVPADSVFRTINLNVSFIRTGRAHPLAIEAVVVARTRQMLTGRATIKRECGLIKIRAFESSD
jgi:Thioesterase superfamily